MSQRPVSVETERSSGTISSVSPSQNPQCWAGSTCLALCPNAWCFVTQPPTGFQSDRNGLEPIFTGEPWHSFCGGPCFLSGSLPGWHPDCWAVPRSSYKSLELEEREEGALCSLSASVDSHAHARAHTHARTHSSMHTRALHPSRTLVTNTYTYRVLDVHRC